MWRKFYLYCIAFLFSISGSSATEAILTLVPNASVVGRGKLSYIFWDIYEATLYAPNRQWNPTKPFALLIKYYQEIDASDIANITVQERHKQGFTDEEKLAAWNAEIRAFLPNIKDGTVLSAACPLGKQTILYQGNQMIGLIKDDKFARLFFGIWLGERTSEPELRRAVLGVL
ncbi:MAG: hypothetical protein BGO77_02230 [Caedibacter sp. 37-49]|nr:MAG: hypothetical protein BGO77_02230 [Caedibacter sp. 37-49]